MKKLMAMIGAVAMSFGLFAATTPTFTISFEQAEVSKGVDTSTMLFTPVVSAAEWAWTGDPLPLTAYGEEPTFEYGTGAFARRAGFDGEDANFNYLPLETGTDELVRSMNGNIYLDQLVKFTGFEDPQTNLVEGTKIAIWMSEFEEEDESTTTNLYVTVGKVDALGAVEQIALKIDGTYALNTWYRLSIKSLGNVFGTSEEVAPHAGFLVYVNGQQVKSSDADATTLIATTAYMDGIAKGYMAEGQLFTAIDDTDATFTTVGYQGIGAVDDIFIDAEGPKFCQTVDVTIPDVDGAEVDYVDVNGTQMQPPISVPDGTTITVYFKATDGKKLTGDTSVTQTITSEAFTIDVKDIVAEEVVATLTVEGEDPEELAESELAAALAALDEGDVIAISANCSAADYTFTPNTTITGTETGWSIYVGNVEAGVAGSLEVSATIAEDFTLVVGFEDESAELKFSGAVEGSLEVLSGKLVVTYSDEGLAVAGTVKAATFDFDTEMGYFVLSEGAKVLATDGTIDTDPETGYIIADGDLEIKITGPVDDYYTYTAQEVGLIDLEITPPENTTVTEVTGDTVEGNAEDGWKAEPDDDLEITLTADEGFYFDENGATSKKVEAKAAAQIDLSETPAPFEAAVSVAATIGTKYYANADAALAAVEVYTEAIPADTVTATFLKAVEKANEYAFAKDVTVTITTDYDEQTPEAPITSFWSITGGDVTFLTGLENNKVVTIVDGDQVDYTLTFAGLMKDGAKITAKTIAVPTEGKILLSKTATIETDTVFTEGEDIDAADEDYEIDVGTGTTYTYLYSAAQSGPEPTENVAKVGDTEYDNIDDAIAALNANGGEFVLLADNQTATTAFALANDATIDLGGFELVASNFVVNAGNVSITNGTIDHGTSNLWLNVNSGILTLAADATLVGKASANEAIAVNGGVFNIYGTINEDGNYAVKVLNGATVNCYDGCSITCPNANLKPYCSDGKCFINIYGGTFTTTGSDSYQGVIYGSKSGDTSEIMIADGTFNAGNDRTFAFKTAGYIIKGPNGVALDSSCTAKFSNDPTTDIGKGDNVVAPTLATGYEFAKGDDDYYTIQEIPSFTVAAITVDNATVVATNTVTEEALALPATVLRDTAIAVTVTPNADYEYATTPAGWTKNENGSITTNATVTADLAITVEAPTAAAAPWPVIPEFPADADDEVKDKYAKWAKDHNVTDPAGTSDAFLMNDDPKAGTVTALEIKSIEVEGTTATITVGTDTTDFDLGKVNGVLYVESTDELAGEWTIKEYDLPTGDVGETATFTVTTGKFMRAKVGFKAPPVAKEGE